MNPAAIFVEGQTELLFCEQIIKSMAGNRGVVFQFEELTGPRDNRTSLVLSTSVNPGDLPDFLIYNSRQDSAVLSDMLERESGLRSAGFKIVAGVRDLYPTPLQDARETRRDIRNFMRGASSDAKLIIAIHECESWFWIDPDHILRMSPNASRQIISAAVGFDPWSVDVETIVSPADKLTMACRSFGMTYSKRRRHVERVLSLLDHQRLINVARSESRSLWGLVALIRRSLS